MTNMSEIYHTAIQTYFFIPEFKINGWQMWKKNSAKEILKREISEIIVL